jgi:NAD(P)H-hydrate epimerase
LLQSVAGRADSIPLVLDAGALQPEVLAATQRRTRTAPFVLLPHAGEFARIRAGAVGAAGQGSAVVSPGSLRETCFRWKAHIALKGAPTRVADFHGRELVICAGGPVLARGGSGDLLAGITGALFARKLFEDSTDESGNSLRTLATAVAWHGAAADKVAQQRGAEAISALDVLKGLDVVRELS